MTIVRPSTVAFYWAPFHTEKPNELALFLKGIRACYSPSSRFHNEGRILKRTRRVVDSAINRERSKNAPATGTAARFGHRLRGIVARPTRLTIRPYVNHFPPSSHFLLPLFFPLSQTDVLKQSNSDQIFNSNRGQPGFKWLHPPWPAILSLLLRIRNALHRVSRMV